VTTYIPAWIYRQFGADYALEYPGEGFGGWLKADAPFDLERCAVVLMHAWEVQPRDVIPGHWSCAEYIARADEICKNLLPPFLETVRQSGMLLIHVADSSQTVSHYPGFKLVEDMAAKPARPPQIERGAAVGELSELKVKIAHPGGDNMADIVKGRSMGFDFNQYVRPAGDEYIATDSDQLFEICKKHHIDHLIYTGFCINFCLMISTGGWVDMSRRGLTCSAVKELVTAVENKESCRTERHKEYGLWNLTINSGVVLEARDFTDAIKNM